MKKLILIIPFLLLGCIRGIDNRPVKEDQANTIGPTINIPPNQVIDTNDLKQHINDKIIASSNTTQNQLSGLLNASVSKLGEKVTGLETNLKDLITLNATMNNTAQAEINAKLQSTITANTELKAEMKNMVDISNKMEARLSILAELQVKLEAVAGAQVGLGNSMSTKIDDLKQTFHSSAGRDVNMLPKQAVDIITGSYTSFVIILSLILIAATVVISMTYRYSRKRAEHRTELEREERKFFHEALMKCLIHVPPEMANEVKREIGELPQH